jgi:DNA (cytosine-5)-methyltransferase 1
MELLRIGTDCSGIDAPIQALRQLGIPHKHVFSSDIDKYCIQTLKANYDIPIIFGDKDGDHPDGDITKRDISYVPDIDLYVCGFPCQPFSQAGGRKGLGDKRGNVFWSCIDVIMSRQPKYFILENVKNIKTHDSGKTWKTITETLSDLELLGYHVKWKILNTRDYGIPQNRERMYIVGTKTGEFTWPEPVETTIEILDLVDHANTERCEWKRKTSLESIREDAVFIDVDFLHYTNYPNSNKYCPCVVARGSSLWCVPYHRYATTPEFASLQGFPDDFKQVVSNCQMKKQFGNSMSVNVLVCILKKLL